MNERNARIRKTYRSIDVINILRSIYKVKLLLVTRCQDIGQNFSEESPREGKLVKNLEIFWMNNKTIIEFGFRMTRRITQISEDVIHHSLSASLENILLSQTAQLILHVLLIHVE